MDIVVVGSIALDSVETPFGKVKEALGGSAVYFSVAASFFVLVGLVGVVGDDFPKEHIVLLESRGVDTSGLARKPGKTFRWVGRYDYDLNKAHTISTELNVFAEFEPEIPDRLRKAPFLFLANIDPELQDKVLSQITSPRLTALDTMNFWIEGKPNELEKVISKVDILLINDAEVRQLADEPNLVKAAKKLLSLGPSRIVVKRGEYGAMMFSQEGIFFAPAYPLERPVDPTGAGDSFAGGFLGCLARSGELSEDNLRQAVVMGSVIASFAVEDFSLNRLLKLKPAEIKERFREFIKLTRFEGSLPSI